MNQKIKIYLVLFSLIILSSCCTSKRCLKKFPPITSDSTIVVYKDSVRLVHDTINIPGEVVVISDSIPCPEVEYHREKQVGRITEKIDISKGKISVICKDDSLKEISDRWEHMYYKEKDNIKQTVIEKLV